MLNHDSLLHCTFKDSDMLDGRFTVEFISHHLLNEVLKTINQLKSVINGCADKRNTFLKMVKTFIHRSN